MTSVPYGSTSVVHLKLHLDTGKGYLNHRWNIWTMPVKQFTDHSTDTIHIWGMFIQINYKSLCGTTISEQWLIINCSLKHSINLGIYQQFSGLLSASEVSSSFVQMKQKIKDERTCLHTEVSLEYNLGFIYSRSHRLTQLFLMFQSWWEGEHREGCPLLW